MGKVKLLKTILKNIKGEIGRRLGIIVTYDMQAIGRTRPKDVYTYMDYVRISLLELVSYEIRDRKILGSVAEVGVYKGDFAKYINYFFPDRKLYLFDTFEGFPDEHKKMT